VTLDKGIILATMCLAFTAAVGNTAAAMRGPYGLRVVCGVRAALAALYVPAYLWLLLHPEDRLIWSQTVVGVSLMTWVLVWNLPAYIALRLERRAKQAPDGPTE
jgi:hypothetical protein